MLTIDRDKNLMLTRGDTLLLELTLENYTLQEGDSLRLAIGTGYVGEPDYSLKVSKEFDLETMTVTIPAITTKTLTNKWYNYDIELVQASGIVDTIISARLEMMGEVE